MTQEQEREAQEATQGSFSAQFEANYSIERKRAQREAREAQEAAETRERDRIQGIFAGTGINGII